MEIRRDVFQAIADPTRRQIIGMLSSETMNLNSLAEKFEMSRPAVTKHVYILEECGLLIVQKKGRERFCRGNLKPLKEVSQWIEKYRSFWNNALDKLEMELKKDKSTSS